MLLTLTYPIVAWQTLVSFVPFGTCFALKESFTLSELLSASVYMSTYQPTVLDMHDWQQVRTFVSECVVSTYPEASGDTLRKIALGVARLAIDALHHGYDLVPEQVFDADFIAFHVSNLNLSTHTLSSLESKLEKVGRTVSMTWNGRDDKVSYPTSLANEPYDDNEVAYLNQWASALATDRVRENAHVLLALGLGAGLRNCEVDSLTVKDVEITRAGVVVYPHGYRGAGKRYVPVSADYADTLCDAIAGRAQDEFVFLPGDRVTGRSCASDFVRRVRLAHVPVTLSRMRTTWIVRLMKAHIPEAAICEASGLRDLQHYVKYRERVGAVSARAFENQIRYAGTDTPPALRAI